MCAANGKLQVGELFLLGFHGPRLPDWLRDFEARFGLGGAILFDYYVQTRKYENNVESREQVAALCAELASLPSQPLVFVDQEGGKVRRLKEKLGFAPLPSHQAMGALPVDDKRRLLAASLREMRELGFHYDLAPVIDLNTNPKNPDIGAVERSFSDRIEVARENALLFDEAARAAGLGLCLKHFPGLGGATVNSHLELTDITGTFSEDQVELFFELGARLHGGAILVSHGLIRDWDPSLPASMSPAAIGRIRARLPDVLLISDDLQMQGLQRILPTPEACLQGVRAGIDLLCIGNNMMAEESKMAAAAEALERTAAEDPKFAAQVRSSIARIRTRKRLLYPA